MKLKDIERIENAVDIYNKNRALSETWDTKPINEFKLIEKIERGEEIAINNATFSIVEKKDITRLVKYLKAFSSPAMFKQGEKGRKGEVKAYEALAKLHNKEVDKQVTAINNQIEKLHKGSQTIKEADKERQLLSDKTRLIASKMPSKSKLSEKGIQARLKTLTLGTLDSEDLWISKDRYLVALVNSGIVDNSISGKKAYDIIQTMTLAQFKRFAMENDDLTLEFIYDSGTDVESRGSEILGRLGEDLTDEYVT